LFAINIIKEVFQMNKQLKEKNNNKEQDFDYDKVGVVLGIVGLLALPLLFGILAIIFGALAKGKGSKKNGALILGIINIGWWFISLYAGFSLF